MSSAHRGERVTTGGLYSPTHLCVAHFELHKEQKNKKKSQFFCFGVVRLGGCLEREGGEMVHVSGGRGFAWGFRGGWGDLNKIKSVLPPSLCI